MGKMGRIAIVVGLVVVVAAVVALKDRKGKGNAPTNKNKGTAVAKSDDPAAPSPESKAPAPAPLPRLVDLGAGKCIPCKMMAPILDELERDYQGKFEVEFIDVWEDKAAGEPYGIRMIPTQIFFDPSGMEMFRHEGFYSKEDILAKWKELGFDFAGPKPTPASK